MNRLYTRFSVRRRIAAGCSVLAALAILAGCASGGGGGSGTHSHSDTCPLDPGPSSPIPPPAVPADNPVTPAKAELGRHLFYDVRLSGNGTTACATCHRQELAFTDGLPVSVGSTGQLHPRNAQSLANAAYNSALTWANSLLVTLEQQAAVPLFGEFPVEQGITDANKETVLDRFRTDAAYPALFQAAFPGDPNPVQLGNVIKALATFGRQLISFDSPYDHYVYGGQADAMSPAAVRGMSLFFSETLECNHCHGGPTFNSNFVSSLTAHVEQEFANTGLYNVDGMGAYPETNPGLYQQTGNPQDMGKFRPPTLRNVEYTAPYTHDGTVATLEDMIDIYAAGGRVIASGPNAGDGRANPFKNGLITGFSITPEQKSDLIAFLKSLSDPGFLTNPAISDPFQPAPAVGVSLDRSPTHDVTCP